MSKPSIPVAALLALLALAAGCGKESEEKIHVYAASSLTDVVVELAEVWAGRAETELVPVFASSSTLARQIREGAPAELFLSASEPWLDYLVRETDRVVSESRLDLLANRLVLVVPPGNPARIESAADLKEGRLDGLAIGDPDHVPAGRYAADWLAAAGLWEAVRGELRPAVDVRAALAYVERGEADAGIVYLTDARVGDVEVVELLDPTLAPPIRYPLALILPGKADAPRPEARALHRWLCGREAAAIFARHGFEPLAARP